jgi:excisionase family DNA binding protein
MQGIMIAKEVADFLKLSESTVYKLAAKGEIPAFKVGDSWRFEMDEIQQLIKFKKMQRKKVSIKN